MCVQNISKKESNESIRLSWSACCGRCGIAHTLEYYTTICDSYWFGWNWYLDRTRERRAKSRMAEKSGWNEDEYNIEKKEESPSQNDDNDEGKQKKKQYAVGHKKRTAFNVTAALFCCISDHSFAHTQTHTTHTYARIHSPKHSRRTLTKHKESQNSNRTYFGWDKTREIADIAKQLKCNTPRYLCVCAALCVRVSVCECERSRTHRPKINRRWRCTINAQTTDDRGGRREREREKFARIHAAAAADVSATHQTNKYRISLRFSRCHRDPYNTFKCTFFYVFFFILRLLLLCLFVTATADRSRSHIQLDRARHIYRWPPQCVFMMCDKSGDTPLRPAVIRAASANDHRATHDEFHLGSKWHDKNDERLTKKSCIYDHTREWKKAKTQPASPAGDHGHVLVYVAVCVRALQTRPHRATVSTRRCAVSRNWCDRRWQCANGYRNGLDQSAVGRTKRAQQKLSTLNCGQFVSSNVLLW